MAKGIIGGMTDYSHQSFDDILNDLQAELENAEVFVQSIEDNLEIVTDDKFWNTVPYNFRHTVGYSLKHYRTTIDEIKSIKEEIQKEVEEHHCKRLLRISQVAQEINIRIGKDWHQDYDYKDYDSDDFRIVERIYCDTRDMAVNLGDLSNIAGRLDDFIGKKGSVKDKNNELNILFLTASPADEDRVRVDLETRKIEDGFEAAKFRDQIRLIKKEAVRFETITKALLDSSPDIVHFSGHGDKDGIIVEDEKGNSVTFSTDGLSKLFRLFMDKTKAVVLNSCYSEIQAKAISDLGIYVVGMNDSIEDEAAISFSTGFYQAIGSGKDVHFAYEMGMVLISQYENSRDIPVLWKNGAIVK